MGFTVSFMKDGESATDIRVAFDDEIAYKHEWVGRGPGTYLLYDINIAWMLITMDSNVQMECQCSRASRKRFWERTLKFAS
jgi:hypothetical protein